MIWQSGVGLRSQDGWISRFVTIGPSPIDQLLPLCLGEPVAVIQVQLLCYSSAITTDLPTVETSWVSAGKLHCTNYLIVQTALHAKPVQ